MANLLELVDQLIGDVLAGNIYTNTDTYVNAARTPLQQVVKGGHPHENSSVIPPPPHSPPTNDPRTLNFQTTNAHPHEGLVGTNPRQHVIPTDSRGLHDNRPDFLDPTPRAGKIAAQTPVAKRTLFYQPEPPRPDVGQQIETSTTLDPVVPREQMYNPGPPPPDISTGQRAIVEPNPSLVKGQSFDPTRTANRYKQDFYDAERATVPGAVPSNAKEVISNIGGTPRSKPSLGDAQGVLGNPPAPSLSFQGPTAGDVPDMAKLQGNVSEGELLIPAETRAISELEFQGSTAGDVPPQYVNPSMAKGQSFDPTRRDNRYKQDFFDSERTTVPGAIPSNAKQVISNIGGTPDSQPSLGDKQETLGKIPASSLKFQGPTFGDVPADLSTIQGNVSQGVVLTPAETVAASQLQSIKNGMDRKDFAPAEGQIDSTAHRLGNLYDDKGINFFSRGGTYSIPSYGLLRTLDVAAISHWLRNVARQVIFTPSQNNDPITRKEDTGLQTETTVKSITWLASQFLLAAFNPTDTAGYGATNALWNPLSLPLSLVPLTRVATPISNITVGAALAGAGFGGYKKNTLDSVAASPDGVAAGPAGERLLQMRQGIYNKSLDGNQVSQLRFSDKGFIGDITSVSPDGPETIEGKGLLAGLLSSLDPSKVSIAEQVDKPINPMIKEKNLYTSDKPYGTSALLNQRLLEEKIVAAEQTTPGVFGADIKAFNLFTPRNFPGGTPSIFTATSPATILSSKQLAWSASPKADIVAQAGFGDTADAPGINAALTDADFLGEDPNTNVVSQTPIPEANIYMPFMFQDLRDSAVSGQPEQFLYFRAFLKDDLSETFTPDWQTEKYYGRVDEIPIYMGTSRIINVSFDIVAWSVKDLPIIYRKLQKLQSMVYPEYNDKGFLQSAPIIRMRIGDLVAGENNRGLPGYITSLDLSYDDGIWNIQENFKVPRKISVSLSFTVLHDGNPGIYRHSSIAFDNTGATVGSADNVRTFGAAKIFKPDANTTQIDVSQADIRKIFGGVRGNGTGGGGA